MDNAKNFALMEAGYAQAIEGVMLESYS